MMQFMRRYGFLIFTVPSIIFALDDFLTNWHDHGHETILRIVIENMLEDGFMYILFVLTNKWNNRVIPHVHANCNICDFKWVMHPKSNIPFCLHCGAPEPP